MAGSRAVKSSLQGHFHAADHVVEHGDAIQIQGDVKVYFRAQEQVGDRVHRELAALRAAVAEAVGEADLRRAHAGAVAQHAQYGDGRHGIAVDAQLG